MASTGLDQWEPVTFVAGGPDAAPVSAYYAPDIRTMRVRPSVAPGPEKATFYKLLVR
jgi:hypothetical protein